MTLRLGDRVRIDIPDELDPDFEFHGEHAIVTDIDHTRCSCGCAVLYRVVLEDHDFGIDMHPWDLRPPIQPMPFMDR